VCAPLLHSVPLPRTPPLLLLFPLPLSVTLNNRVICFSVPLSLLCIRVIFFSFFPVSACCTHVCKSHTHTRTLLTVSQPHALLETPQSKTLLHAENNYWKTTLSRIIVVRDGVPCFAAGRRRALIVVTKHATQHVWLCLFFFRFPPSPLTLCSSLLASAFSHGDTHFSLFFLCDKNAFAFVLEKVASFTVFVPPTRP
jgi:hypothetical protein